MLRWSVVLAGLLAAGSSAAGERVWEELLHTTSADLAAVATLVGTAAAPSSVETRIVTYWDTSDRHYRCLDDLLPDGNWGASRCEVVRKDVE